MSPALAAILSKFAKAAVDWARNWAKKDARPRGTWAGRYDTAPATPEEARAAGYRGDLGRCVRVTVDSRSPLRFIHESGAEWAIGSGLISDGGSIPSWAQKSDINWLKLKALGDKECAFFLHDEGYHNGCLWMRPDAKSKWVCVPVTRAQVDLLMYQGLTACKNTTNAEASLIYAAVRTPFGASSWKRCQQLIKKRKSEIT